MVTLCFPHTETMAPRPLLPTGHPEVTFQVPARCYRKSISACHMPHVFLGAGGISHVSLSGFPPGGRFARCVSPELSRPLWPAGRSPQERVCVCVFVAGGSCGAHLHNTSCPVPQKRPHWVASVVSPCEVVKPCRQNVFTIYTSVKGNILDRCLHMGLPCMLEVTRILVLSG